VKDQELYVNWDSEFDIMSDRNICSYLSKLSSEMTFSILSHQLVSRREIFRFRDGMRVGRVKVEEELWFKIHIFL
jgi:hypothetical protein